MGRLILWDIDGTLVRCGDISVAVFDMALEATIGRRPPTRIPMAGKTDPQIVAEHLELLEIEPASVDVDAVLAHGPDGHRCGGEAPGLLSGYELFRRVA